MPPWPYGSKANAMRRTFVRWRVGLGVAFGAENHSLAYTPSWQIIGVCPY